jgi:hypothetical protein
MLPIIVSIVSILFGFGGNHVEFHTSPVKADRRKSNLTQFLDPKCLYFDFKINIVD